MSNILLIEDYMSLRNIYHKTLLAEKHTVYVAKDGNEGLEIAKSKKVDLIILDMLMPDLGGLEFLKAYDPKKHPETKLIVLSNIFSADLLNKTLELGASHYLLKADVTPTQLAEIVRQTLK